ncbi:MAG: D-glycerate dehydrogenase [Kofleriaceae bacterium]
MVRVVSTSSLPIDLAAAIPDARVEVPEAWRGVARCDLTDADALVCLLLDRIDATVIARAPKLRVIANCAVGYDNIDVAAATRAGIAVTNTPDVLTEATAELAFALMLAAARRLPEGERLVRGGAWPGWRLDQLLGVELHGKTLGVIGLGRIGKAVVRRAEAFGMRAIWAGASAPGAVGLDELFERADVVSLHCPLTPETRHLVDAHRLAQMKPTAILVNTARGGCIDEPALIEALHAGRIFAAALDVFEHEPEIDRRFYDCPRLVLAPHIGSATTETRTQMARLCADAVIDVLAGRRPPNLVNRDVTIRIAAGREALGG